MPQFDTDAAARRLYSLAVLARRMPPSWDGARDTVIAAGDSKNGPGRIGQMLPGRGLSLDVDLKSIGITRPIPYVYERTPLQKTIDRIKKSTDIFRSPY